MSASERAPVSAPSPDTEDEQLANGAADAAERAEREPEREDATTPPTPLEPDSAHSSTALPAALPAVDPLEGEIDARGLAAELLAALARPPRYLLSPGEAAKALGMSRNSFERYVRPEVRIVRRGRLVLVPVAELERWVERNAARLR